MKAWLLVVIFNSVGDDAKLSVFNSEKDCEVQRKITETALGKSREIKAVECIKGELKEDKEDES